MSQVIIKKKNETYLTLECEPHIKYELSEIFTFEVPNFKFMPQYRSRHWDGKIKLFSPLNGELYCGLYDYLIEYLKSKNYSYELEDNKYFGLPNEKNEEITPEGIGDFVKSLNIPMKLRDYQYKGIYEALKHFRKLLLSPTASGKSMIIYCICRYFVSKNHKTLIIVPTTSLVEQLTKDFKQYGWDSDFYCHKIYAGSPKTTEKQIVVSTWQSIYKMPKKWFEQFDSVVGDEAHLFKAKSLTGIMSKLHTCKYRVGFTGTLDGTNVNKLVLEGLFGPVKKVVNTSELIDKGHLSNLKINILLLKHEYTPFANYQEEVEYLVSHKSRNKFIRNLCKDLTGNTLVLFSYVEKHGLLLHEMINIHVSDNRKVFLVYGGVDTEEREEIREITENEKDAIIVASYGTFSTGINIRNLHNVIFASPSKSRIRNLQSIGRVLRKGDNKTVATLYDIADDISSDGRRNYTLNHLTERIKIYSEENFNYEIIPVNLRENI